MLEGESLLDIAEREYASNKKVSDEIELIRAYKRVFNTPDGQRILDDLKRSCCYDRSTLYQGTELGQYHEGRRSVVLNIQSVMKKSIKKLRQQLSAKDKFTEEIY